MRTAFLGTLLLTACGSGTSERPMCTEMHAGGEHARMHHDHTEHGMATMQHDFSDVARFEAMFDAPDRASWQRPVEVIALLGAQPGQTVVDLGTGTGYFLPFLSIAVGASGHVVALDSEPAMIDHVRARAQSEALPNVEARTVVADDPGLAPDSVDHVLVVDTWHHLPDRASYVARLAAALRPGGTVLVVDFGPEATRGPPPSERVSEDAVATELTGAGLIAEVLAEHLPEQYVVRGRRP